jgi:Tol biopolymer transport system component
MMKKLLVLTASLLLLNLAPVGMGRVVNDTELHAANDAWHDGDYITALRGYIRLLKGPSGDQYVEAISLQTGELFQTEELTTDGRSPRLSPDGQFIAYETGTGTATVTRIVKSDGNHAVVADLPGVGAVFSPSGGKVAYVKPKQNDEIAKAQAALQSAQGQARIAAQQAVNWLQMKYASVMLRDLATPEERELNTGNLLKGTLAFGADNETIYFIGAREEDTSRNDIYAVTATSQPTLVTDADGFKTAPIVVDPRGKVLIFAIPNRNPFPPPPSAGAAPPAGQGGGQGPQGGGAGGFGGAPTRFGIVDLANRKVTAVNGTAFTLSDDGASVAYLTRAGQENSLMLMPVGGAATAILKTSDRLDAPTFSPDSRRLAYQKITRDDWEIYLINRDGSGETRLTREIQHDVLPRFISNDRLLAMIGEPRHRRSYIYDLPSMTRTRLFHNNTVRTVVPEYAWMISRDGAKVLISAERDGDTVSPERGVYLVRLDKKVTKADVLARLEKNLASEIALRDESQRIFAPIADEVRRTLAQASTHRIYEYEKALFDFDSKHISRPGNHKAIEYLYNTYKSFGYEPEYQWFEPRNAFGGKTANVMVTLRGTENPEMIYVVGSHFDSVAAGPGAEDDTSGTAALLEAARMLAGKPMPATVILVSFTGEEGGLLGSREFVRRAQADKLKITGVLNNDTVGWANDSRLDNTIRYTNAGIRDVQHAAAMLFTRLVTYDARYHRGTDATSFYDAYGDILGGIGSYPILGNPHYHQPTDLLDTINHQLITETSKTTTASIMLLASSPSPVKDLRVISFSGKTAELTWTPSPEKSVRSYIVAYGPPHGPQQRVKVTAPRVTLQGIQPGTVVAVKAVNARGLEGWDWTRTTVAQPASASNR